MGRRKSSSKKVIKKKKQTVATVFKCPCCSYDKVVECQMDFDRNIGSLRCRICNEQYQCAINYLSEPIDVFSEWTDEIVAINQEEADEDSS
mmetsp:Transcript_2924/g.5596  ORF Transcript_2924/g.5596 Transcript_2924/m.5596 type:complete len:91 (-) Transcript_2924:24-296(-)